MKKNFLIIKKYPKMTMYGYGYRYPKAQRIAFYDDPEYRFRWVRAAIGNRATAAKSPWIKFLKDNNYLEQVGNLLREAGAKYRAQYGVKPSTKKGAKQRITKLQRAIATLEDEGLLQNIAADLGDKYNKDYVTATIDRLKDEITKLAELVNWQPPAQPSAVKQTATTKKAKGYGLLSGLGYDQGYGYFY
jgi:hypothetical protein